MFKRIAAVVVGLIGNLIATNSNADPGTSAKIYVAGPLGFSEAGRMFQYTVLLPELRRLGYEVIDPWVLTEKSKIDAVSRLRYGPERREAFRRLDAEVGAQNKAGMDECNAAVAVLDGPDVDSGTAAEIGYVFALKKPIIGYRGDMRLSSDNEGSIVNLQVEYFIRASGGDIVSEVSRIGDKLRSLLAPRYKQ